MTKFPGLTSLFRKQLHPLACMGEEDFGSCEIRQNQHIAQVEEQKERMNFLLEQILNLDGDDLVRPNTSKNWLAEAPEVGAIRFMSHKPDELVRPETALLTHELMKALKQVKKDAYIVSPYLIPTEEALDVFRALTKRGVRIRVVTNSLASTDNILAQAGYHYRRAALIRAGVEIYEYKGPSSLHAKAAIFDRSKLFVGTYNLDPRSAFINREVALEVNTSGALARDLIAVLDTYRDNAVLVAKDGVEQNLEWQKNSVPASKRARMMSLLPLTPFVINQL